MEASALLSRRAALVLSLSAIVVLCIGAIRQSAHAFDFGCIPLPTGGEFCFDDGSSSSSSESSSSQQSSVASSAPASSVASSAPSSVASSQQSSTPASQTSSQQSSVTSSVASSQSSTGGGTTGGGGSPSAPTCLGRTATIYVSNNVIVGGPDAGGSYLGELNGTVGDDVIVGTAGTDDIEGKDGNDFICSLGGTDTVEGGDGNDTIMGGDGVDSIEGNDDNDTLCGEAGNDIVRGGFGDDILCGGNDADQLIGDAGNDKLEGGAGTDTLDGRTGTDICYNGENLTSCEDAITPVPACSNPAGSSSSSIPASSASSVSSVSSSSSGGNGGNGGGIVSSSSSSIPVTTLPPSGGSGGNGGSVAKSSAAAVTSGGGGSRTKPLAAAVGFLQRFYESGKSVPNGGLNFAPGAFGGSNVFADSLSLQIGPLSRRSVDRGTPLSGIEKRLICSLIKTVKQNEESQQEEVKVLTDQWTAVFLSHVLGRHVTDVRAALRDPELCDGMEGSVIRSTEEEEEVAQVQGPMTFVLGPDGAPMLEGDSEFETVWNNCVRNRVTRREDGRIYNCSRYQVVSTLWGGRKWVHPFLGVQFGWNYRTKRITFTAEDYRGGEGIIVVQREATVALGDDTAGNLAE